jgi:hypothetical protein
MCPFQMFAQIIIATSVVNCAPVRQVDPVADPSQTKYPPSAPTPAGDRPGSAANWFKEYYRLLGV